MATEIITVEDLEKFEERILQGMTTLINERISPGPKEDKIWIKSHNVQRMLGISAGTLQNLRINGTIPYSKIGGVIFYDKAEIQDVIERNKQNV